jgi:hypothetical protein
MAKIVASRKVANLQKRQANKNLKRQEQKLSRSESVNEKLLIKEGLLLEMSRQERYSLPLQILPYWQLPPNTPIFVVSFLN